MIEERWEHGNKHIKSFGWVAKREARVVGIADCEVSPTVILSSIPPWIFSMSKVENETLRMRKIPLGTLLHSSFSDG